MLIIQCVCLLAPQQPQLQAMLEADFPWHDIRDEGSLHHEKSDQVVGQQIDLDLFEDHIGCLATEDVHSHRLLDVADIQLDSPALLIESFQIRFAGSFGAA